MTYLYKWYILSLMTNKITIAVSITPGLNNQLNHLATYSGWTKSDLIAEGLEWVMKNPPQPKKDKPWLENPIPQVPVDYNKEEK